MLLFGAAGLNCLPVAAQQVSISGQQFDCVIEPFQVVKLASPVVGVISAILVERGDLVTKGQVLGKLEDGVEQANLAIARSKAADQYNAAALKVRWQFLQRKAARASQLASKSIGTEASRDEAISDANMAEQQFKEAELTLRMAQLEVKQAEKIVEQRVLRSPFDGVVTEILLHPGEIRNEQSSVMSLAQVDPLRVEVFVPTRFYGQIRAQSVAEVTPEQPVGGVRRAKVTIVDSVLDAASGTFGVRLELTNHDHGLPAGLSCKVRFGA